MSKKVGLPALIITLLLLALSIYLCYNLMVLNTDYGELHTFVLGLAVVSIVFAVMMLAGCYAVYMDFSQDDLEKIGDSAQKK